MEIGPANRVDMSAPVTSQTGSQDWLLNDRQAIAAVQWLNQAEWLGQDRELTYRRDPKTGKLVIQILPFRRELPVVVDQLPQQEWYQGHRQLLQQDDPVRGHLPGLWRVRFELLRLELTGKHSTSRK